jgi:site-specific DNA recombinase
MSKIGRFCDNMVMAKPRPKDAPSASQQLEALLGFPWPYAGRPPRHDLATWTVSDDWPDAVPVASAEVDVFEAWFGTCSMSCSENLPDRDKSSWAASPAGICFGYPRRRRIMTATPPTITTRAALYLRVSTARQAEHDLSIPDQKRQGQAYCAAKGLELVETFVEAGASATNDRRPEFQRMIEAGTSKPAPFDVVVVHSFSRFFRDHFELEFYIRKLAKNGVRLLSITQEMGDDPMHVMMRQIMALFDEYQSKETAKHVLRAMRENARQGFWNGSLPPIGYRVVAAEQRGAKTKKKLEIDPFHADTVRSMFQLALKGDGKSGSMGVKAIAAHLNSIGITTRDGGLWGVGAVHLILTRSTYTGRHEFNRRGKGRQLNPISEIVSVDVPPIIDQEMFNAVQARMKARNPKAAPPQVVGGPTLLTGLIHCAKCGGAMTIRTGKGGRYRYYTCSTKARQGPTGCEGMTVPMEKLDELVADYLEQRLLTPERLEIILSTVLDRRQERTDRKRAHISELNKRATETDLRLKRLYDAIENGIADIADADFKDRIASLKATRDQARVDADRATASLDNGSRKSITPQMLSTFADTARQRMRLEGGGYRRDHFRALAQRVEVDTGVVRIIGSKSYLLQTLTAAAGTGTKPGAVPSFVPKWCTQEDSNLWPLPSEGSALSS